jgi:amino acid adenylation domain-containing protein
MASRSLANLLEASAARSADGVAVVDSNGCALKYSALDRSSSALAAYLRSRGIGPGDRVAVAIPKGLPAIISAFGILKAGAAYVPIDAAGPLDRGRQILRECTVKAAVTNTRTFAMIRDHDAGNPIAIMVEPFAATDARAPSESISFQAALDAGASLPRQDVGKAELAYIIFTSGSTGVPKGAMITHENALSFIDWCSTEFQPTTQDRFANHAPWHFDASVLEMYLSIKHGAALYLISDELGKRPKELARFVASNHLTFWNSTPSALAMLALLGELPLHDWSKLRIVCFGGEVFPAKSLRGLQRQWRAATFYNLYGPTEATTACTFARIPPLVPEERTAPYPIGFPCSHMKAVLLDEQGIEVSEGNEGLLHVSGPSVFAGYWNRPDDTFATMRERDGVRWYNTGDVARWDPAEGFTYVGRRDRMVKRRGFRIELAEIEQALHLHPDVHEAAAIAVKNEQSELTIVAFAACIGRIPSTVELKTFCAKTLPAYMMPDSFVFRDRLPRSSTDKVDYGALTQQVTDTYVS